MDDRSHLLTAAVYFSPLSSALDEAADRDQQQQAARPANCEQPMFDESHRSSRSRSLASTSVPTTPSPTASTMMRVMPAFPTGLSENTDSRGANTRMRMPTSRSVSPTTTSIRFQFSARIPWLTASSMPLRLCADHTRFPVLSHELTTGVVVPTLRVDDAIVGRENQENAVTGSAVESSRILF